MRQERCKFLRHGWGSDDIFAPLPYLNRVCDFFQREVPGATVESQFLCGTGDTLPERFGQIRTEHILDVRSLEYGLVDVGSFLCHTCLLYTSDAADDLLCVDLGGRRIIKKKKKNQTYNTRN